MKENEFIEIPDAVVEAANQYFSKYSVFKGEKIGKESLFFFKRKKGGAYYRDSGIPPTIFSYDKQSDTAQFAYIADSLPWTK